jgi:hypothetical protein
MPSFLSNIDDPHTVITAIDSGIRFPEVVAVMREKYEGAIRQFATLVASSSSSGELLGSIRTPRFDSDTRMALLKIFRRCVSGVCDTEATKKITVIPTSSFVDNYGASFKPIEKLKEQFATLSDELIAVLAVGIGEYDNRGQQGYVLTKQFFDWFEAKFKGQYTIEGPKGAGRDIQLRTVMPGFTADCPCDLVIRNALDQSVKAVGFARYDSTRGGAQSDDRTGGNASKVYMIRDFCKQVNKPLRVLFVADGPGLAHKDTWIEAVRLDDALDGEVRVTTLKLADQRVTLEWLRGDPSFDTSVTPASPPRRGTT